jgi:hypothetical protein
VSAPAKSVPKVEHPTIEALRMFLRNPSAIAGMAMLFVVLAASIAGPWVLPADPFEIRAAPLTPPFTEQAWLGTDYLGRDVLTTLIYGGRATLLVWDMHYLGWFDRQDPQGKVWAGLRSMRAPPWRSRATRCWPTRWCGN